MALAGQDAGGPAAGGFGSAAGLVHRGGGRAGRRGGQRWCGNQQHAGALRAPGAMPCTCATWARRCAAGRPHRRPSPPPAPTVPGAASRDPKVRAIEYAVGNTEVGPLAASFPDPGRVGRRHAGGGRHGRLLQRHPCRHRPPDGGPRGRGAGRGGPVEVVHRAGARARRRAQHPQPPHLPGPSAHVAGRRAAAAVGGGRTFLRVPA